MNMDFFCRRFEIVKFPQHLLQIRRGFEREIVGFLHGWMACFFVLLVLPKESWRDRLVLAFCMELISFTSPGAHFVSMQQNRSNHILLFDRVWIEIRNDKTIIRFVHYADCEDCLIWVYSLFCLSFRHLSTIKMLSDNRKTWPLAICRHFVQLPRQSFS